MFHSYSLMEYLFLSPFLVARVFQEIFTQYKDLKIIIKGLLEQMMIIIDYSIIIKAIKRMIIIILIQIFIHSKKILIFLKQIKNLRQILLLDVLKFILNKDYYYYYFNYMIQILRHMMRLCFFLIFSKLKNLLLFFFINIIFKVLIKCYIKILKY